MGLGAYADFEDVHKDVNNEHAYEQGVRGQWPVVFNLPNPVMRQGDNDEARNEQVKDVDSNNNEPPSWASR